MKESFDGVDISKLSHLTVGLGISMVEITQMFRQLVPIKIVWPIDPIKLFLTQAHFIIVEVSQYGLEQELGLGMILTQ